MRLTVALLTLVPDVPVTVIEYVPGGVLERVFIVKLELALFPSVTEGGLKLQLAPVGSPAQPSVTVPLNPNVGAIVTVEVAEDPAVTVAGDKAVAERSNPGAVVLSNTPNPLA